MKKQFTSSPFFLYLLPVFFVLHGYTENYSLVPIKDASWLALFYIGCTVIVFLICRFLYKDSSKANMATFALMSIYFFFGTIHDTLKSIFPGSFFTKYSFILPLIFILALLIIFLLKKSGSGFKQAFLYLNTVLLVLIVVEVFTVIDKASKIKSPVVPLSREFVDCSNCETPDIYLIVADGYTSNTALKDIFKFDNAAFEAELDDRGFHVINNSFANYNFTIYSLASLFSLNFIDGIDSLRDNIKNLTICSQVIKNNQTSRFLKNLGYKFYNYSDIDFAGHPAATTPTFLLGRTTTITSQTLSGRIYKDLWFHLATDLKLNKVVKHYINAQLDNNNKIYELTKDIVTKKSTSPKFIYSHITMPHNPYYFDKDGNPTPVEKLLEYTGNDRNAYIGYLQYGNKKYLELIDYIKTHSEKPPVIILIGDHGFRDFNDPKTPLKYHFMNLSAINLPNRNYDGFYDSSSSVNQIRTFLNNQFNQQLPLLKDSTVFIQQ